MMQVTKVWWDGEKLMAEPIDPSTIYQEPAQQKPDFWEGYVAEPDKRQQALDKIAEIARDLGLTYEPAQYSDIVSDGGLDPRNKFDKPAQQEPVAHQYQSKDGVWRDFISQSHYKATVEDGSWPIRALYTSPPAQRTWVGLTDEEIVSVVSLAGFAPDWVEAHIAIQIVRVLEAKLKEKNT